MKKTKRPNNDGSVYKRASDSKWVGAITLNGNRRVVYGSSQQEALDKLTDLKTDKKAGLPQPTNKLTVGAYIDRWLALKVKLAPTTKKRYAELFELHVKPDIGKVPLARLTAAHLDSLYAEKLTSGLAETTVHHIAAVVHAMLQTAYLQQLVKRNVADFTTVTASIATTTPEPLTPAQTRLLMKTAAGTRYEGLWLLLATSGLRLGEALSLRWPDIADGVVKVVAGKTATSVREVPLLQEVVTALAQHRVRQAEERLASIYWGDDTLVFTTAAGTKCDGPGILRRHFKPLLKKAGLRPVRIHDLRHGVAVHLLDRGVNVVQVSRILGHSQPSTTLNIYGDHTTDDGLRDAVATLGDALAV